MIHGETISEKGLYLLDESTFIYLCPNYLDNNDKSLLRELPMEKDIHQTYSGTKLTLCGSNIMIQLWKHITS